MRETKETCDICGDFTDNKPNYLFRLCPYIPPDTKPGRDRDKYYATLETLREKECCPDCNSKFDTLFESFVEGFINLKGMCT